MTLIGLPDWHRPLAAASGEVYAGYQSPGRWFAPPLRLVAPPEGALRVDTYSQDRGPAGGLVHYGVHTLRFEVESELGTARESMAAVDARARVDTLPLTGGTVRLTGPALLVDPFTRGPALGAAIPLDQAGLASFVATVSLDDDSSTLVIEAYRAGASLIGADAVLAARGVAARFPATVTVDLALLAESVARFARTGADAAARALDVEVEVLRRRLEEDPASLGIALASGAAPTDDQGRLDLADALLDRLVSHLGAPVPPLERDPAALALGARLPLALRWDPRTTAGVLRWNLTDPHVVTRCFGLGFPPTGPLEGLPRVDRVTVRHHEPPALDSGWHAMEVSTTVSPPWAGASVLGFELRVPPAPPERPQEVVVSEFFSDSAEVSARIALSPGESLAGTIAGTVLLDTASELDAGIPVPVSHEVIVLRTDAFPAAFVPLRLDESLVGCAVTVRHLSGRPDAPGSEAALGTHAGREPVPALTFVLPFAADGDLIVEAVSPDGLRATSGPLPVGPLLVDPFVFTGTGRRELTVVGDFAGAAGGALGVELVPEGRESEAQAVGRVALRSAHPEGTWTWLALSPFATGFRFRVDGSTQWSGVHQPDAPLLLRVAEWIGEAVR